MAEIPLGLLGFAAGAMQAGRTSPHPMGFGEAFGGALNQGVQNYGLLSQVEGQRSNQQMRQMMLMQQIAQQRRQAEQEAAKQEYLNQYASTLPPEQQALARLAPDALISAQVENQFRQPEPPKTRTRADGSVDVFEEWDPQLLKYVEISRAPRWAPQQPQESGSTTAIRTRAAKIEDAMRQFGVNQAEATKLVDGLVRINTDPVSGMSTLVDLVTGDARPVEEPVMAQPDYGELESPTLYSLADRATGLVSAAEEVGSGITGQFGGPVAEQTILARQNIRNAQNDLIRALSINPRFPVGEIERIQQETNIAPSVLDSPGSLRARMQSIDSYLSDRLKKEQAAAGNRQLPRETRQAAAAAANDIAFFLQQLGVPSEPTSTAPAPGSRIRFDTQGNRIQ